MKNRIRPIAGIAPALALSLVHSTPAPAQVALADGVELYHVLRAPSSTCAIDVDADGIRDIIFGSSHDGTISWLRSEGGGAFAQLRPLFKAVSSTTSLDAIDLDGDGDVEIIRNESEIWTQTVPGSYAQVLDSSISGGREALADLDSDGRLDALVTGAFGERSRWRRGLGGLNFGALEDAVDVDVFPRRSLLADMNGDGDVDLVVADTGVNTGLRLFVGDGSMPFRGAAETAISFQQPTSGGIWTLTPLDADQDGDVDLVVGIGSGDLWLVENLGNLAFAPATVISNGVFVRQLESADIDGDGDLDLVERTQLGAVGVLRNLGSGSFASRVLIGTEDFEDFHVEDLDGDGAAEVFLVDGTPSPQAIRFDLAGNPSSQTLDRPFVVSAVIDVDRDGLPDLVGLSIDRAEILLRRRTQSGDYADTESLASTPILPGRRLSGLVVGDLNGDGLEDLVAISNTAIVGSSLIQKLALPGGGYGPETDISGPFPGLGLAPNAARLQDIDNDLDLDVVLPPAFFSNQLFIARNDGTASFTPELQSTSPSLPYALKMGDVDDDQLLDIVVAVQNDILWRKANTDGTFQPVATLISEVDGLPTFGDTNGDGLLDYFVPGDGIRFAVGLGSGQFDSTLTVAGSRSTAQVALIDLDLDGRLELLASGLPTPTLLAWEVPGFFPVALSEPALPDSLSANSSRRVLDVDGDGDLDILLQDLQSISRVGAPVLVENETLSPVGANYCDPAVPNSTGTPGELEAYGSTRVLIGSVKLLATSIPPGSTGFFLASLSQGLVTSVPGSAGTLCLSGQIGRFVAPGQVGTAGLGGTLGLQLDLTAFPSPSLGLVPVQSGQTWNFQAWHRDTVGGQPTSNFTDGLSLTFL